MYKGTRTVPNKALKCVSNNTIVNIPVLFFKGRNGHPLILGFASEQFFLFNSI